MEMPTQSGLSHWYLFQVVFSSMRAYDGASAVDDLIFVYPTSACQNSPFKLFRTHT